VAVSAAISGNPGSSVLEDVWARSRSFSWWITSSLCAGPAHWRAQCAWSTS